MGMDKYNVTDTEESQKTIRFTDVPVVSEYDELEAKYKKLEAKYNALKRKDTGYVTIGHDKKTGKPQVRMPKQFNKTSKAHLVSCSSEKEAETVVTACNRFAERFNGVTI